MTADELARGYFIRARKRLVALAPEPVGLAGGPPRAPHVLNAGQQPAFDRIREFYAMLPEARMRGYKARRFSFNKPGGRCD